eukprot:TRINITY_DN16860_c0_g1_i1.p1 TRINITY_DN16860_c0_g1~~TRINITY_DN16860_c0_g1_i1.p1  ORF type:complete len:434 (+),score=115.16 TRINITY_DN16860_c0_g1_i1:181-1302(+)
MSQKLLKEVRAQQQNEEGDYPELGRKKDIHSLLMDGASSDGEDCLTDHDDDYEEVEVDEEEEAALSMFMDTTGGKRILNLGDMILAKIKEKELQAGYVGENVGPEAIVSSLDPKVLEVYSQIATLLKRWRSGRLPRAVKIIPLLDNWEEVLWVTKPEEWSMNALGVMTKIFSSNFNEKLAQRYYNLILLPAIRGEIRENKKLNFHLWLSLKKALYKPTGFYKGVVIPLCETRDCTLREALAVCSVLSKVSVPPIPSSVALMKIAQMPYSGANSIFIKCLINKRYALPYRVIDALVEHFLRFREETRELPVVWHQSLLAFAQRYKEEISAEQKHQLKLLLRERTHSKITPEIRRELFSTKCRGQNADMDVEMKM